jgi:hypothetical protein
MNSNLETKSFMFKVRLQRQGAGTVSLPPDHVQVVPLWDCDSQINENLYQ